MISIFIITGCICFSDGMVPAKTNLNSTLSVEFVDALPENIPLSLHYVDGQRLFLQSRIDQLFDFDAAVHDIYCRDRNTTSDWHKRDGPSLTQTKGLTEHTTDGTFTDKEIVFIIKLSDGTYVRSKIVNGNDTHDQITYKYPNNIPNDHLPKMRNTIKISQSQNAIFSVRSDSRTIWSLFVHNGSNWIQKTNRSKTWAVFPVRQILRVTRPAGHGRVRIIKPENIIYKVSFDTFAYDLNELYNTSHAKFVFFGIEDTEDEEQRWVRSNVVVIHRDMMEIIDSSAATLPSTLSHQVVYGFRNTISLPLQYVDGDLERPSCHLHFQMKTFDLNSDVYKVYRRSSNISNWLPCDPSLPSTELINHTLRVTDHSRPCEYVLIGRRIDGSYVRSEIVNNYTPRQQMEYYFPTNMTNADFESTPRKLSVTKVRTPCYQFKVASREHVVWNLFVLRDGRWIESSSMNRAWSLGDMHSFSYDLGDLYLDLAITEFAFVGIQDHDTWIRSDAVTIVRDRHAARHNMVESLQETITFKLQYVPKPTIYFNFIAMDDLVYEFCVYSRKRGTSVWWRSWNEQKNGADYMFYWNRAHQQSYDDGECEFVFIGRRRNGSYVRSEIVNNYDSINVLNYSRRPGDSISDSDLDSLPMELDVESQGADVNVYYNDTALWSVFGQKEDDRNWWYNSGVLGGRVSPADQKEFVYDLRTFHSNTGNTRFVFVGFMLMDERRWIRSRVVEINITSTDLNPGTDMEYVGIRLVVSIIVCCLVIGQILET